MKTKIEKMITAAMMGIALLLVVCVFGGMAALVVLL